jgi:integrase
VAGSIRPRLDKGHDAWELRVYLGRDAAGRVRHKSRLFRGTKRAAERELARLVLGQDERPEVVPDQASRPWGPATTFNDAISGWRDNGWDDLSPLTAARYESIWRLHIEGGIGRQRIASTGPYDVERYFRQLKQRGAGRETVRYVRAVLHRSCRLARKWSGNTLPNPVTDTELPNWSAAERPAPVRAPSLAEVLAILRATTDLDIRYRAGLQVVAATGMRRGEACGLRWNDVDTDHRSLMIDEAVIPAEGGAAVKSPKTRASVRRVAVDAATLAVLDELWAVQRELAAVCAVDLVDDAFILSMEPGGAVPLHPDSLSHAFAKARKLAGVPPDLHLHSLRHFQATALDTVISERQKQSRLGWSTVHMARHYTDPLDEEDRRAAEHLGALLSGTHVLPPAPAGRLASDSGR